MILTVVLQSRAIGSKEVQVERDKLAGANIILHQGRYYVYGGMGSDMKMRFNETAVPVELP